MRIQIVDPVHSEIQTRQRACAYCRVSTESLLQGESLENQVSTFEREIRENPDYEFCGVYADEGISGSRKDRPQFQRMLKDAKDRKFDLIITKSVSRFARNTVITLQTIRELKKYHIGVYFQEQNINTLSSEGELMMTVEAAFAQEELRSMSNNLKWSIRKRFEQGKILINTNRFLGYDKNEYGELVINHEQAELVRRIFQLYLHGRGISRIAKLLNQENIPTLTGEKWCSSTIRDMLVNEKYKGDYLLQKYYVPEGKHQRVRNHGKLQSYYMKDNHPAIISPEDWDRVQTIMAENRNRKHIEQGNQKYSAHYPLSGLLYCPYCGRPLKRKIMQNHHVEWWCSTYIKEGKRVCRGIKVKDTEVAKRHITGPTTVEEVIQDGKKYYRYTSRGAEAENHATKPLNFQKIASGCILPRLDRDGRTIIKL